MVPVMTPVPEEPVGVVVVLLLTGNGAVVLEVPLFGGGVLVVVLPLVVVPLVGQETTGTTCKPTKAQVDGGALLLKTA